MNLSVIVCAYNAQDTIKECLQSVLNQDFENFEVICIDDGSVDSTYEILSELATTDKKLHVISQKNQGLSIARNIGLSFAKGDWVMFMDSDDILLPGALKLMYKGTQCTNVDAVIGSIDVVYDNYSSLKDSDSSYFQMDSEGKCTINESWILNKYCNVWGKLFKRKLIVSDQLLFPEHLYYEDVFWHWSYFFEHRNCYLIKEKVYRYFRKSSGIMALTYQKKSGMSIHHLYVISKLFSRLKERKVFDPDAPIFRNLLEIYFWNAYNFSAGCEKYLCCYECGKILLKYGIRHERSACLRRIYEGVDPLGSEGSSGDTLNYARFLKLMNIIDVLAPKESLRRKLLKISLRTGYHF